MAGPLRSCNDTYTRDEHGVWRYPWGEEVPGAQDLTLELAQRLGLAEVAIDGQPHTDGDGSGAPGSAPPTSSPVTVTPPDGTDVVIGLLAPELSAALMLTVADIGEAAGVTKATIDSYRHRGYLPDPQVVRARTPLWTRPIIRRWLEERPGCGWRTDVYGGRLRPIRRMPLTGGGRASGHG